MDLESRSRWEEYTKAKETMLERTHIPEAPWWIVEADDKKRARLNCIRAPAVARCRISEVPHEPVALPERVSTRITSAAPCRPSSTCRSVIDIECTKESSFVRIDADGPFHDRAAGQGFVGVT